MSQNREKRKNYRQRGARPKPRNYLYLLMRIILVILQLLLVAAHSDEHGVYREKAAHVS